MSQIMPVDVPMPISERGWAIIIVSAVMMGIAFLAVCLRCLVRLYLVRAFGWDDALMVIAMALFSLFAIFCILGAKTGVGHKMEKFTSFDTLERALLWWWLGQILYVWSSAVTKISIALALLRLTVRRVHRITLWIVIGVVIAIGLMLWLVLLLDCNPVSYFWRQVNPLNQGTCLSTTIIMDITYLYSTITILCDFTLGIMPAVLIWGLQMNSRTKAAVAGILSLGAVASVAVVIRLPFIKYYADREFLYSTYQIAIWSVMETGLGIIAGSLITLRPLFRWFLETTVSSRSRKNARYGHRSGGGRYNTGKYPLSSLNSKTGLDPKYWRPDITEDKITNIVTTSVSSPMARGFGPDINSSQEDLNPTPEMGASQNQVNVHKSFRISDD